MRRRQASARVSSAACQPVPRERGVGTDGMDDPDSGDQDERVDVDETVATSGAVDAMVDEREEADWEQNSPSPVPRLDPLRG